MSTIEQTTAEVIEHLAGDPTAVVYYSKHAALVLCRRPKDEEINSLRQLTVTQKALKYNFAPEGRIVVREGQDPLPDGPNGEVQDAVAWLDRHVNLNTTFFREGREPDRALPTERDFLTAVNRALVSRDPVALRTMLEAERATHGRTVLVDSATSALHALRDAGVDIGEEGAPATALPTERKELVDMALSLGLEVTSDATDEQLRAAVDLATAPSS